MVTTGNRTEICKAKVFLSGNDIQELSNSMIESGQASLLSLSYAANILLDWLDANGIKYDTPDLSNVYGDGLVIKGSRVVYPDELDRIFRSVSLFRERQTGMVDRLGRFDERAIVWDISEPWVDNLAREIALDLDPFFESRESKRFQVIITHDMDRTTPFEPFSILNSFGSASGIRKSPWWPIMTSLSPHAIIKTCERLLEYERSCGIGAYYFMMSGPFGFGRFSTRTDIRWGLSRELVMQIQQAGMNIGLHGSYGARDACTYKQEKDQLEEVIGHPILTHRNHYLRFDPEKIYSQLDTAGIAYDFSIGFGSKVGFRAGLGGIYRGFDFSKGHSSIVRSVPLLFMDSGFFAHDPEIYLHELRLSLLKVKKVSGCVSLLFHPEEFLIYPDGWAIFTRIINLCMELGADLSGYLPPSVSDK